MPLLSFASSGTFRAAVLVFVALAATWAAPIRSQQPGSGVNSNPGPALPPQLSQELNQLQADLKAAQLQTNAKAEARTLNAIGVPLLPTT